MAKPAFRRGLTVEFVNRLNEMYQVGGWWRNMVEDKDFLIAIRDNYINIYFQGCSVLKLSWSLRKKEIIREIHYKYLLKPSIEDSPYIGFGKAGPNLPPDLRSIFLDGLDDVGELKRAVMPYADAEKKGVHDIVVSGKNPNVLDLEIAISEGKSAPRIDLAEVQEYTGPSRMVKLVFYEAKHFKNKELRSSTDQVPVVRQIIRYSKLIAKNRDSLLTSYQQVCRNLTKLEGVGQQNSERHAILRDIATGYKQLQIDDQPRLIAFGFDKDQRDGANWKPHEEKLRNALGRNRALFAGKAGNIRLGQR
ncbi:MAG: hypothetical protein OXH92_07130 [Bryobacterales bacterium]|nr:hypothetical protein [Bryobacterales bacterium]